MRIEISRDRRKVPSSTGTPYARKIEPDLRAAAALAEFGEVAMGVGLGIVKQAAVARDSDYIAKTSVRVEEEVSRLSQEMRTAQGPIEGHAQRFMQSADSIYQKAIDDAPSSEARRVLENQFAAYKRGNFKSEFAYESETLNTQRLGTYQQSLNLLGNQLIRNPEQFDKITYQYNQSLEALKVSIPQVDISKLGVKGREYLASAYLIGISNRSPAEAIAEINSGAFDGVLPPDKLMSIQDSAEASIDRAKREAEAERIKQHKAYLDQVDLGIYQEQVGFNDLDQMLRDESISTKEYLQRVKVLDNQIKARVKETGDIRIAQTAVENRIPLDPTDKDSTKAIDTYFRKVVLPTLQDKDDVTVLAVTKAFVRQTNIVPDTLKQSLTAGIRNGSHKSKIKSAEMINDIVSDSPAAMKQFKDYDVSMARKISKGIAAGLSAEESIKSAEVQVLEKGTEIYKSRVKDFNENKAEFNPGKFESFSSLFGGATEVPPGMQADFEELYRRFNVDLQNDLDDAEEIAYNKLKTTWDISTVSGKPEWMKFSPEKEYGVEGADNSWIRNQLIEDVKSVSGQDVADRSLIVRVDPTTYNKERKVYLVGVEDDNGAVQFFKDKDGTPLRWLPDSSKEADKNKEVRRQKLYNQLYEKSYDDNLINKSYSENIGDMLGKRFKIPLSELDKRVKEEVERLIP